MTQQPCLSQGLVQTRNHPGIRTGRMLCRGWLTCNQRVTSKDGRKLKDALELRDCAQERANWDWGHCSRDGVETGRSVQGAGSSRQETRAGTGLQTAGGGTPLGDMHCTPRHCEQEGRKHSRRNEEADPASCSVPPAHSHLTSKMSSQLASNTNNGKHFYNAWTCLSDSCCCIFSLIWFSREPCEVTDKETGTQGGWLAWSLTAA